MSKKARTKKRGCGAGKARSKVYVVRTGNKVLATGCKGVAKRKVKACAKRLAKKGKRGEMCYMRTISAGRVRFAKGVRHTRRK